MLSTTLQLLKSLPELCDQSATFQASVSRVAFVPTDSGRLALPSQLFDPTVEELKALLDDATSFPAEGRLRYADCLRSLRALGLQSAMSRDAVRLVSRVSLAVAMERRCACGVVARVTDARVTGVRPTGVRFTGVRFTGARVTDFDDAVSQIVASAESIEVASQVRDMEPDELRSVRDRSRHLLRMLDDRLEAILSESVSAINATDFADQLQVLQWLPVLQGAWSLATAGWCHSLNSSVSMPSPRCRDWRADVRHCRRLCNDCVQTDRRRCRCCRGRVSAGHPSWHRQVCGLATTSGSSAAAVHCWTATCDRPSCSRHWGGTGPRRQATSRDRSWPCRTV